MREPVLVLVHGFWSSPSTWDRVVAALRSDPDTASLPVHRFGYESPKLGLPFSWTRIPDYDDIAQSLDSDLSVSLPGRDLVVVTHSQGGLIMQRFLAWMVNEGRGRDLARIRGIVMLACPNEGSDYARSIRRLSGFGRHAQARDLRTLASDVATARRTVQNQIVHASGVSERQCPIPMFAYAGRTDRVVQRPSAQSAFSHVGTIPGNHFSILDPAFPGSRTVGVIKKHVLAAARADELPPAGEQSVSAVPSGPPPQGPKYSIQIGSVSGMTVGDHATQTNNFHAEAPRTPCRCGSGKAYETCHGAPGST